MKNKIAIVGVGLRFPGADTPDEYWDNISNGKDCLTTLSDKDLLESGVSKDDMSASNYVRRCSKLDGIDYFDAEFFGFTAREASFADPQLRLLLEVAYECIENTGSNLFGKRVGVYIGAADHKYWLSNVLYNSANDDLNELGLRILAAKDYFASQISYKLNLTGPSISLASACSSALLSVHEAYTHLLMHDCDYALAGGSDVVLPEGYLYEEGGILAKDGYVRPFDEDASGTVFGSGVGLVMLKRLEDALESGDHIYSVICGSGANNDGNRKAGFSAPSVSGQADVIYEALARSEIDANDISYVETHGTGTPVGDPIEIEALSKVYSKFSEVKQFCAIGSVKSNLGHLSYAAGMAGLIKISMALKHSKIPPSLHFKNPNPHLNLQNSPFYVNTELRDWSPHCGKKYAGLSAFGIGGTNVHMVLEEPPCEETLTHIPENPQLIVLSAKSSAALDAMRKNLAAYLLTHTQVPLEQIAYTLATGRKEYKCRFSVVATDREQLRTSLLSNRTYEVKSSRHMDIEPDLVFIYPGQGSQYIGMAEQLYQNSTYFKKELDLVSEIAAQFLNVNLLDLIFPCINGNDDKKNSLNETEYAQPALFAVSYALSQLLNNCGLKPKKVLGHSLGEYIAACVAGVMHLEDAVRIVCTRAKLMQKQCKGSMLAVKLGESAAKLLLEDSNLDIAAVNGATSIVISGDTAEIIELESRLGESGIHSKRLNTSHAFHSRMMEPMLSEFESVLETVELNKNKIPLISNVTGELIDPQDLTSVQYWVDQIRKPVLFHSCISTCLKERSVMLEVGPNSSLTTLVSQGDYENLALVTSSLGADRQQESDYNMFLESLGEIWSKGIHVEWNGIYESKELTKIPLPTYPFQRSSYWLPKGEERHLQMTSRGKIQTAPETKDYLPLLSKILVKTDEHRVYESLLSNETNDYVRDHKLMNKTIFPGSGYTSMLLNIAKDFFETDYLTLNRISFKKALMIDEGETKLVHSIGSIGLENECSAQIVCQSISTDVSSQSIYAEGVISRCVPPEVKTVDLEQIQKRIGNEKCVRKFYKDRNLIVYGEAFQALVEVYSDGSEVLAKIELPDDLIGKNTGYVIHPVLLDACFQATDFLASSINIDSIPIGMEDFHIYQKIPVTFWVLVSIKEDCESETEDIEITILSISGEVIGKISKYVQQEIEEGDYAAVDVDSLIYRLDWEKSVRKNPDDVNDAKKWVLLCNEGCVSESVEDALSSNGQVVTSASSQELLAKVEGDKSYQKKAHTRTEFFDDILTSSHDAGSGTETLTNIVYFWPLGADVSSVDRICLDLINLIKSVDSRKWVHVPSLWVVTRGCQIINENFPDSLSSVAQAALWGLCNTLMKEHPELCCRLIDLDNGHPKDISLLMEDLLNPGSENRIGYRFGERYVPRIIAAKSDSVFEVPSGSYRVGMLQVGMFDNLIAIPQELDQLDVDDIHVEMHSVALNFKETLWALGMVPYSEGGQSDIAFGLEGAGKVTSVGKNVKKCIKGDRVLVWKRGCLGSDVVVNQDWVYKIPSNINYIEASTIPTIFMTAYYALICLGKIRSGDTVLIHAAAGGVGQAAIQIARQVGAKVIATASKRKWQYLKSQGIEHVFDSRSLEYRDQIAELTNGTGVELVLNSFSGKHIDHSFDVLSKDGRFIEIGKLGTWSKKQANKYRPDVEYTKFELGEAETSGPKIFQKLISIVLADFESGKFKPVRACAFPISRCSEAYRLLASGQSIGKVVVEIPRRHSHSPKKNSGSGKNTYLVTGGLGGIGIQVAEEFASQESCNLILLGRNKPNKVVQKRISAMKKSGSVIEIFQADVSDPQQMKDVCKKLVEKYESLSGIIHCAGILHDATLENITPEILQEVTKPKIQGALLLHELSQKIPTNSFICFSSTSALFDGAGQGNYAAANAFMDALMGFRKQIGLPALSVNWCGWKGEGMTKDLVSSNKIDPRKLLTNQEAFRALEGIEKFGLVQAVVAKLDVKTEEKDNPLFKNINFGKSSMLSNSQEENHFLSGCPDGEYYDTALIMLKTQVAKIVGIQDYMEIEPTKEFSDIGIDSLMLTELKNRVQSNFGDHLKMSSFFAYPTVEKYAAYLESKYNQMLELGDPEKEGTRTEGNGVAVEAIIIEKSDADKVVFCFPGINENVADFRELSQRLKGSCRVIILQSSLDPEFENSSINVLVRSYVAKILEYKLLGGCTLVGYSYGGTLALETAKQLLEMEQKVDQLLMIDSAPHFVMKKFDGFKKRLILIILDSIMRSYSIGVNERDSISKLVGNIPVIDVSWKFHKLLSSAVENEVLSKEHISEIVDKCLDKMEVPYDPPCKVGSLCIDFVRALRSIDGEYGIEGMGELKAAYDEPVYGWDSILNNEFRVRTVDCDHNELLTGSSLSSFIDLLREEKDCIE